MRENPIRSEKKKHMSLLHSETPENSLQEGRAILGHIQDLAKQSPTFPQVSLVWVHKNNKGRSAAAYNFVQPYLNDATLQGAVTSKALL